MSSLLLPFAKHIPTGRTVAPEEVERGNACECECLFCNALVQARHCSSKANHFAHQPKKVDDDHPCPASFERCIFWMTKRILEEGSEISLPEYKVTHSDYVLDWQREYTITAASRQPYVLVDFPDISDALNDRIDIVISINGHPLRLIISYSSYFIRPRDASIHISLDYLKNTYKEQKQGFLLAMQELIIDSVEAKEWLFHSGTREEKCKRHFKALVKVEKDRRKTEEQARQLEADRAYELRQQRLKDRNNPQIVERTAKRLGELLNIARRAAENGAESGWQCHSCYVVSTSKPNQCVHCGQSKSQPFDFTEDNMSNLENKFYCGNYAAKSLAAAPVLIL
ncbi:hypothetical protein KDX31_05765 [Amphritea atlantica]|uniref:RanBP2-type domain-containing protein n=1 Tax=Amphritea atlantica TaxID=355243 RepID=A0ABY5GWX6_9GAMM|nr:hypothetical protein KDX31_05765 [Amphritea atlantica]